MRYDINAVLEQADTIEVAEHIGMTVIKRGAYYFTYCPGHKKRMGREDSSPTNCVLYNDDDPKKKGYRCFACNKSISLINMVMEYTDCSFPKALEIIVEASNISVNSVAEGKQYKKMPEKTLSKNDRALVGLDGLFKKKPQYLDVCGIYSAKKMSTERSTRGISASDKMLVGDNLSVDYYSCYDKVNCNMLNQIAADNKKLHEMIIISKAKSAYMKNHSIFQKLSDKVPTHVSDIYRQRLSQIRLLVEEYGGETGDLPEVRVKTHFVLSSKDDLF